MRLSREACPVADLLGAELQRWRPQARTRGISLSLQQRTALPVLDLDRMRMSQALGIVVHNALQHTKAEGRIVVAAAVEPDGKVAISVSDDGRSRVSYHDHSKLGAAHLHQSEFDIRCEWGPARRRNPGSDQ